MIDWKVYFASLSNKTLYEFWDIIKREMAERSICNLPDPTEGEKKLAKSQRILAIKEYRQRTGAGLSEAMNIIDKYR
jgi:hypothetical protein